MKNKGYTLIELLGVMIILSLILSLAIPSIINVIKSSTNKKDNLTNDLIINAAEMYVDDYDNEFFAKEQKNYCVPIRTLVELGYLKDKVEIDGKDITDLKSVKISYTNKYSYKIVDNDDCIETYFNGEIVYFDVATGKGCDESEYHETNSNIGYNGFNNKADVYDTTFTNKFETQNSCLKFYAFNDEENNEKVNLLLDHNTTTYAEWNADEDSTLGPIHLMSQFALDTENWQGTETPKNYSVSQTVGGNYTIDYSTYKARLITANEIAQITGNTSWNELTSTRGFYFDSLTETESDTCKSGDITGCKYGWLYDRLSTDCVNYGCLNNADSDTMVYWTSTSVYNSSDLVWYVDYMGGINNSSSAPMGSKYGLRPVIEVLKTKL